MGEEVQPEPVQKKGFFEKLGMFQKAILFVLVLIVFMIIAGVLFGGISDFFQFFFYVIIFSGVIFAGYIVLTATGLLFKPRYFSPREDLRTKMLNMASDYKPDNVRDLYFTGDVGKKRVLAGKIVGILGMPYYCGNVKRDKNDKVEYTTEKDFDGKPIPIYEDIKVSEDGDTLFVVKKGFIFTKTHLIRCKKIFHSTLNGDVDIYDINPVPYGMFEYPYKQMQESPSQVMVQNQIETILATHEHQHDLISQGVDSAIYFNPVYRFSMKAGSEIPEE